MSAPQPGDQARRAASAVPARAADVVAFAAVVATGLVLFTLAVDVALA